MIELASAVSLAFAEFGKQVASEAAKRVVGAITSAYKGWRGESPKEDELDPKTAALLASRSPEVRALIEQYLAGATVLRRAELVHRVVAGAKVLWIDDHPAWNFYERKTLESIGASVQCVESTFSALSCLALEDFDLILSDIARAEGPSEGIAALPRINELAPESPVIFYVGAVQWPHPKDAFGIASHPGELLHLCLDALERSRI
jgi:CheY-like chemotaxis protein